MTQENLTTENLSEEEARAKLEEAAVKLKQQLDQADRYLAGVISRFDGELAATNAEIASLQEEVAKLAPFKDGDGGLHYDRLSALLEARRAFATTIELELAAAHANQDTARTGMPTDWDGESDLIKRAQQDPRYREARVLMDYYLAGFHWLCELETIDVLLRASGAGPAIRSVSEDEEARRQANGENFKRLLDGNDALKVSLGRMLEDLQVAEVLLPWAKGALLRLTALDAEGKRAVLADADWAKLNGVLATLQALPETVRRHDELAAFPFVVAIDGEATAVS